MSAAGKKRPLSGVPRVVDAALPVEKGIEPALGDVELAARFDARVASRAATVAVVGLGCVGLPLSLAFWRAGFRLLGFDTDAGKLARLARGESPLRHVDGGAVAEMARSKRFAVAAEPSGLRDADALCLCVPTPLDARREPDLSHVVAAARTVAAILRPGQLVVLESTTWPGTTRELVLPILEAGGLRVGRDFWLAYSPEREDPGRSGHGTATTPKLVAGFEPASAERARALYAAAVESVHLVSRPEVAEAAKLLENTFRAVNIALVNELKIVLDRIGVDVWEVVEAAATKPFGFMKFTPGPGMGGHCIPVDPFYLAWVARRAGTATRFVELAGEVNRRMPEYVVERTLAALGPRAQAARVLVLGIAYKPEVDAVHESPALRMLELFAQRGLGCRYSDPWVPRAPESSWDALEDPRTLELDAEALRGFDAVVVATDHAAFDWELIAREARLVIDTRNALGGRMAGDERYHRA